MKLRIIQDLQCPKCGNKIVLKEITKWNNKPYCDGCDTMWVIAIKPNREHIRIEYEEVGGDDIGDL